ncbi:tetratricopeptide repeat protein [Myxococcota bacterium]|nr:tetratricopeptide repeat protein [Myxococcota bacterium]
MNDGSRSTPLTRRLHALLVAGLAWGATLAPSASAAPVPLAADGARGDVAAGPERTLDPSRLLDLKVREAGSASLLEGNVKAYAEARRLLARGQAAAALKALGTVEDPLFVDRRALLRGDALLALGDAKKAREAYETALVESQLDDVSLAAARGMVAVLGVLKDKPEQLRYLDAILDAPNVARKPNLLHQRALILRDLGRGAEAAEVAWKVARDYPASPVAEQASTLLKELSKKGTKIPVSSARIELGRIRRLIAAGEYSRAEAELKKLEKQKPDKSMPKLDKAIALERAEIFRKKRQRGDEYDALHALYVAGELEADEETEVLKRLGKAALARDDAANAQKFFAELEAKYPNDPDAVEGQYLAAWIPYNAGDYEQATERMLAFANGHRRSTLRPEALWFAGWSAYLGKRDGLARRAFEQLLEEHPNSELRPQARYWIARIRQRNGEADLARETYRQVLAASPLGYWGFWATRRLEELGEKVALEAPPPTKFASVNEVIELLGPKRPINIDRAIALHKADLEDDALDELSAANGYLKKIRDTAGRTMIADLLQQLGAHHLAYRVGASIAQDGADLVTGKSWAWRAWRHAYPRAFEEATSTAATTHEIDTELILAIMRTESSFRTNARSPVGAYGLMQLMPNTASLIGRTAKDGRPHAARYKQPESNVWLGAWYLAKLVKRYDGQLAPAIGAYNAGPAAMDRWIAASGEADLDEFVERVPYRETRRYIRKVLETYMVYQRLTGKPVVELPTKLTVNTVPEGSVSF